MLNKKLKAVKQGTLAVSLAIVILSVSSCKENQIDKPKTSIPAGSSVKMESAKTKSYVETVGMAVEDAASKIYRALQQYFLCLYC